MAGLVTSAAVGLTSLAALLIGIKLLGAPIKNGLDNPNSNLVYLTPLLALYLSAAAALQLYLQGVLTAKLYKLRNYPYSSRWQLIAAYPLASYCYAGGLTLIAALAANSISRVGGIGEMSIPGAVLVAGAIVMMYTAIIGACLNWTVSWSAKQAKLTALGLTGLGVTVLLIAFAAAIVGIELIGASN